MSDEVYFSVVIPLYNKERHILRAVNSVLHQSYKNFELIVVNDGSTDCSVQVLYPHITKFTLLNQKNGGEAAARNAGMRQAKYSYIAFLDADDEWHEDFLKSIFNAIQEKPEGDIYCTNYLKKSGSRKEIAIPIKDRSITEIDYFEYARKGHTPISSSSVCISAGLVKDIGEFPEGIKLYPDLYYWSKAALQHRIIFIKDTMATYHRDADNRVCNQVVPTTQDTYFEQLLINAERTGALKGSRLKYAKEFLCHYKLLNAFKALTQNETAEARAILNSAQVVTKIQSLKKFLYIALSFLPNHLINSLWLRFRKRHNLDSEI